jgi:nitrite reductase/ring-hydroxylating ferredoxin subunit
MTAGETSRHIAGEAAEVLDGRGKCFMVAGRKIAVFHVGARFFALDDRCSHADAAMSDGWITGNCVSCPWHGAEFDLATGEALSLPATKALRTYPVVIVGGKIEITVAEGESAEID